jgi:hypothetical protein
MVLASSLLSGCVGARTALIDTSVDAILSVSVVDGAFTEPSSAAVRTALPAGAYLRQLGGAVESRWVASQGECFLHATTEEHDRLFILFVGYHARSAPRAMATLTHWLTQLRDHGVRCCVSGPQEQTAWSCSCHSPEDDPSISVEAMVYYVDRVWVAGLNLSRSPILRTHSQAPPNPGMQRTRCARR